MRCSCCGEEVGNADICPICGSSVEVRASAPKSDDQGGKEPRYRGSRYTAPKSGGKSTSGDDGADLYENNVNGVLEIRTNNGSASGYIISKDGYAVTNSHAVCKDTGKSCGTCTVSVAGESVPATVVAMGTEDRDEHCSNNDLALLKMDYMPAGAIALKFGDYSKVRTGERIYIIGNSLGRGTCITSGIVSDKARGDQLMYDCPTNPGNSGGPVFNSEGLVIGTHVAGTRPTGTKAVQGMNFAIPCRAVVEFLHANGIFVD